MISHVTRFINLNDRDFVIHPKPQDDELLSSWLVRVALANDTAATSFTNMHFREYARNIIWQRDLDIWCPQDLMKRLSEKSHLSKEQILDMTLKSYEGKLQEHINGRTRTRFIQPLGNYCHIKRNGGLRFCPKCLKEDMVPYFRKIWRLSFYTACIKHDCFLHSRCPTCGSPLVIYKHYNERDFTFCYKCGTDLKTAPAHTINKLSYGLKAVECLLQILSEGYGIKFGKKVASIDFFHFLKQINKMIYLWRKTDGVFEHEILGDVIKFNTTTKNKCYEDFITIEEQYLLYSGSCFLIQSDSNFKDFIQNNHILQCHIYKDFR